MMFLNKPVILPPPRKLTFVKLSVFAALFVAAALWSAVTQADIVMSLTKLTGDTAEEVEAQLTNVPNYSSVKTLWNINLGFTNSNFLISYDGVVTAGIDLTDAKIDMREDTKRIYVLLPEAEIMSVEIDFNSFQKYSEREGIGNRITLENYNDALKSIDETARQKAVDKGILNRAYENARVIVQRMIGSLVDLNEYSLEIGREYP